MTNRLEGKFCATIKNVDLSGASGFEFYVKQANHFFQYVPEIIQPNIVYIEIPYEDAMQLHAGIPCKLQCAWTDKDGNKCKTKVILVPVEELLKKDGYK